MLSDGKSTSEPGVGGPPASDIGGHNFRQASFQISALCEVRARIGFAQQKTTAASPRDGGTLLMVAGARFVQGRTSTELRKFV
jgi:hypothetical protein